MKKALVSVAVGLVALTGCVNTPPPGSEVADEMIDALDVSDDVKECMRQAAAGFQVNPESGFDDLDAAADAASDPEGDKYEAAKAIIDAFEAALAKCN